MNNPAAAETVSTKSTPPTFRPLRAWPAFLLALLIPAARFGPRISEDAAAKYWMISIFGPILCCLLLLIWWLAASRATWRERVFGFLGLIATLAISLALGHPSMRGPATMYLVAPLGFFLFAIAVTFLRNSRPAVRSFVAILFAFAGFSTALFLRADGMTGDYKFVFHPRSSQTTEETMLAAQKDATSKPAPQVDRTSLTAGLAHPEWPEFRGADRSGRTTASKISTNWNSRSPQQLWKTPVGPAWSSFSVAGRMLFTQEQRGPKETVVCYDADTGKEIWKAEIDARLDDPMGGPGPRATPTISNGALYVAGSTGFLMRLDPSTGAIVWKKDLTQISGAKVPMWGFSDSPLVIGQNVIAYAGGGDKGLVALDAKSGDLRWSASCPIDSYSSPQLNNLLGEDSVLMLTKNGLLLFDPATGKARFTYDWPIPQYRALQPTVVGSDTILIPTGMTMGTRAIRLKKDKDQYTAEELWTSRQLKPDFVDLVTYQGYAYGNDGGILTCIDLKTGERKWKGGHYGKGQILLLENSAALLILSEQGQVVLVAADPSDHHELATFPAIEGKTWNHPVLVNDHLYVRNSQEAAAYKL